MKTIPILLLALLAAFSFAHADVVTDWNATALLAIKTDRTAPPKAARPLAMMHAAIYDAVSGVTQTHEPYFVRDKAADGALPEAAAAVAARLVLLRLFPAQQAAFDATYKKVLRAIPRSEGKRASINWDEHVAQTLLSDRAKEVAGDGDLCLAKSSWRMASDGACFREARAAAVARHEAFRDD